MVSSEMEKEDEAAAADEEDEEVLARDKGTFFEISEQRQDKKDKEKRRPKARTCSEEETRKLPGLSASRHIQCKQQLSPGMLPRYACCAGQGRLGGGMSSSDGHLFSHVMLPLTQTHRVPQGRSSCGMCLKLGNRMPAKMHDPLFLHLGGGQH